MSTPLSAMPDTVVDDDAIEVARSGAARRRRSRRIRQGALALAAVSLFAVSSAACASPGSPRAAINQYFGSEAPYATRIAICESNLDPRAYSPTHDVGLFQINRVHWSWIRAKYGYDLEDLKNPYKNARVAKDIRNQSGWSAWTCSRKI